ncbi:MULTISPECIES: sensor histidine kinase [Sporosarcina]|uniref:histidine kinase n=1 Tax=Sporosarcina contaminans TaxID=633403 RepID=A0ABW3TV98_9BACL
MKTSTLEQLCVLYTDLNDEDIETLKEVAATLQLYADLSESYMFIDCKIKNNDHAIVVAEAFPQSEHTIYENSVVGKIVFESFEPGVFYSYRKGEKSIIHQAVTQEGKSVDQTVVPIKNKSDKVIGVLIQEKEVESAVFQQKDNISIVPDVSDETNESGMHVVTDLLMEMLILTDQQNRLIYANPVGLKFISEMGHTDQALNRNIIEMMPFLKPVYDQQEDVFVFDLTIDGKSLVVKKIRMSKKDKTKETLLIIQDLTELRMKEKELMMKSVVIQEIHHRVKNNLQTVASLLRLQMRQGVPEESKSSLEDTLNRIYSISSVYELILAKEHADDDDVNIVELTRKICTAMVINETELKLDLIIQPNGNKIITTSRKAVSIALIVNELIQNSLKHAFRHGDEGQIQVDFFSNEKFLELHITDNGVGMNDPKSSLGMEIIRNLVTNDLNGDFHYAPTKKGTHAVIIFPVSPEVEIFHEKEDIDSGR